MKQHSLRPPKPVIFTYGNTNVTTVIAWGDTDIPIWFYFGSLVTRPVVVRGRRP